MDFLDQNFSEDHEKFIESYLSEKIGEKDPHFENTILLEPERLDFKNLVNFSLFDEQLLPEIPIQNSFMGRTVARSGSTIMVGAPYAGSLDSSDPSGTVYIFDFDEPA